MRTARPPIQLLAACSFVLLTLSAHAATLDGDFRITYTDGCGAVGSGIIARRGPFITWTTTADQKQGTIWTVNKSVPSEFCPGTKSSVVNSDTATLRNDYSCGGNSGSQFVQIKLTGQGAGCEITTEASGGGKNFNCHSTSCTIK